jgi:hypothetical protein
MTDLLDVTVTRSLVMRAVKTETALQGPQHSSPDNRSLRLDPRVTWK